MYIKDIPFIIYNLIFNFNQNKKETSTTKILKYNENNLYHLKFFILDQAEYNPEVYNNSHEDYITREMEIFIKNSIGNKIYPSHTKLIYNFDDNLSYKILISIEKIIIENEFIYIDEKIQPHIEKKRIEAEKIKKIILKQKLFYIICEQPGIDLGKIIQKTRAIKNPEIRKQLIKELLDEKKIILELDNGKGRSKRIYKPV